MKDFDVINVPLEGKNLVEASAGTGKTYSVAILVLRLIIEKNIPVSRILMVTFTNAAVAELAHRIRKFIRLAIRAAQGEAIAEPTIQQLIQQKLQLTNPEREALLPRLQAALSALDEAHIQTIHSFCQDSLQLFAFESNQAFGLQLQEDLTDLVQLYTEDFWRNHITGLSINFQSAMHAAEITIKTLKLAVMESLGGKHFNTQNDQENYDNQYSEAIRKLNEYYADHKAALVQQVNDASIPRFTTDVKEKLKAHMNNGPLDVYAWLQERTSQYKTALKEGIFHGFMNACQTCEAAASNSILSVIQHATQVVVGKIKSHLQDHHLLTFDDMINKLHLAVRESESLRTNIAEKYDAVFIDEFQDTDKLQYEIYDQLFGNNHIIFYIGDPKQSIYSWRKADINTYLEAARQQDVRCHTMNLNYRSTPALLAAFNEFFNIENPFLNDQFGYIAVQSGLNNNAQGISIQNNNGGGQTILDPIHVFDATSKQTIPDLIVRLLAALLSPHTLLDHHAVSPSNIAILVRTNDEGKMVKQTLSKYGIAAVNMDETNVFKSAEAEYLEYTLETVLEISWKGVNKALLNPITGWNDSTILSKNSDRLVSRFKHYQTIWHEKGVYAMMRQYMVDFKVFEHLSSKTTQMGRRRLTNLNQLLGLLQEAAYRQELKPTGLLAWLKNQRRQPDSTDNQAYQQRLEDDRPAITIITIHKSKGLEFPLVIAPYINLGSEPKGQFSTYRDDTGEYQFFYNKLSQSPYASQHFSTQAEQENRRLLYVALTRAKYHCFVFNAINNKNNCLIPFLSDDKKLIIHYNQDQFPYPTVNNNFPAGTHEQALSYITIPDIHLPDDNWRKMSFSFLSRKAKPSPKSGSIGALSDYENFIFKQLPRGANIGDMLHGIFERIDFQDREAWELVAQQMARRYYPQLNMDLMPQVLELMHRVSEVNIADIGVDFSLSQVLKDKKVTEWEFDICSATFDPSKLMDIPKQNDNIIIRSVEGTQLRGILNGLADMIFEYQGKYYILDWKSNYLGDTYEDYKSTALMDAMNENNYHLQYLLYTYALHRYLQSTLDDYSFEKQIGGVVYVFLRGLNPGNDTGLFFTKPTQDQMEYLDRLLGH